MRCLRKCSRRDRPRRPRREIARTIRGRARRDASIRRRSRRARACIVAESTLTSSVPATASTRTMSPLWIFPIFPPAAASGVTWMAAGTRPDAPDMRPSVTSATRNPRSLQHAERGRELVQFRHAVRARTLEAHHGDEIAIEFAAFKCRLHVVLFVEHDGRRLDHETIIRHGRYLDRRAADIAVEHAQAAVAAERIATPAAARACCGSRAAKVRAERCRCHPSAASAR